MAVLSEPEARFAGWDMDASVRRVTFMVNDQPDPLQHLTATPAGRSSVPAMRSSGVDSEQAMHGDTPIRGSVSTDYYATKP